MNEIIKNIRKNYIIDVLKGIIPTVLLNGVTIGMLYGAFYDGFEVEFFFLAIVSGLFSVTQLVIFIKSLILAINPFKSNVFKKYGTPEKIASIYREIEKTTEYKDHTIVISHNYICHRNSAEILVACNDVLAIHKLVHKTNFLIDYYQIVITDKYGEEFRFTYNEKEEAIVDTLLIKIKGKCRNAETGYTQDELDHIRKNKVSLNNNTQETPFVATFKSDAEKREQQIIEQKQRAVKQNLKNAWKTFWKYLGLLVLSIVCSEMVLMIILGDSIKGSLALVLVFLISIPFFGIFYYLFIKRKKKALTPAPSRNVALSKPKKEAPTTPKPITSVSDTTNDKIGNYAIINNSLSSSFTNNAREIIKKQIKKTIEEYGLTRKTDLMKVVFEYVSQEFANAQEPETDLVISAYYQIAFDEIVTRYGDMNALIFSYSDSKVSGTINKDLHRYPKMMVRIQIIIDEAIESSQNCDSSNVYSKQLQTKVLEELNSYIDDTTDWNKL